MKPESKNRNRTNIEIFCWKDTSEREAICRGAWRILNQRKWAKILTTTRIWLILVALNALITVLPFQAMMKSDFDVALWIGMAALYIYMDVIVAVAWQSYRMSLDPKFDWAEDYKDLLEERRQLRKKEHDEGLPRSKF